MTDGPRTGGTAGFLEFFILEAGDYVEQLDGLLLNAGTAGPNADAMQRVARALRGTATMAKIPAFADLAAGVERVGRALREGALRWEPGLVGALVAAVDELKTLLRAARSWSPAEDQRANARTAELLQLAPSKQAAAAGGAPAQSGATSYFATEAANIAAGLELLTTHAGDSDTAANVLRRVRALRGVAGVKEIAPLADALEAIEDAGRPLESGSDGLSDAAKRLLETAAAYLRGTSSTLRSGGDVNARTPARAAFDEACEVWSSSGADRERVVPIADLFYSDDSKGLVEASQHPPTTASERFRMELVSLGEHLRQVVTAARTLPDPTTEVRVQRELRRILQAIESAAESFDEVEVAAFVRAHAPATDVIDFLGLNSLDDLAAALTQPGALGQRMRGRLSDLAGARDVSGIGLGFGKETPPASAPPLNLGSPRRTPTAAKRPSPSTAALLDSGIAALEVITTTPLAPRAAIPEDEGPLVPIESLLYRGRPALDRAVELRDAMRSAGPPNDPDALEELFDLLELARAD